jgi:hypothetical protein
MGVISWDLLTNVLCKEILLECRLMMYLLIVWIKKHINCVIKRAIAYQSLIDNFQDSGLGESKSGQAKRSSHEYELYETVTLV